MSVDQTVNCCTYIRTLEIKQKHSRYKHIIISIQTYFNRTLSYGKTDKFVSFKLQYAIVLLYVAVGVGSGGLLILFPPPVFSIFLN